MSQSKILTLFTILAACACMVGCEKNKLHTSDYRPIEGTESQVKVVFMSPYRANPRYQINVNAQRVSNVLSAAGASPNPTPFPGGGLNTGGGSSADYLAVPAQQNTISIAIPKFNTNVDSVQLATSSYNYEVGKKYSLYFTDTAANTTTVLVQDSLTRPDSGFVRYKFVNLLPDLPALDLYIGTVKVASNIPYKGVSPSFILPTNNASSTWAIRTVGGTTNLATYASASTLSNQRVFTVIARGYNAISTSSDIRRRAISLIYNE
jgi:hypothetical protein